LLYVVFLLYHRDGCKKDLNDVHLTLYLRLFAATTMIYYHFSLSLIFISLLLSLCLCLTLSLSLSLSLFGSLSPSISLSIFLSLSLSLSLSLWLSYSILFFNDSFICFCNINGVSLYELTVKHMDDLVFFSLTNFV
jgi:hypothetical protein